MCEKKILLCELCACDDYKLSNTMRYHIHEGICLEVVSKPSIGLKVKANCVGQPQEYQEYFEDWTSQFNTETCPPLAD